MQERKKMLVGEKASGDLPMRTIHNSKRANPRSQSDMQAGQAEYPYGPMYSVL